jgi:cellulose biosynthesis protein BcsQ
VSVIAVYNAKGGVGKTALSVNLAHAAAAAGRRTLLWDLDEQGGASLILGQPPSPEARRPRRSSQLADHVAETHWPGVSLVASESLAQLLDRHDRPNRLRGLAEGLSGRFDRVIVDCPPTLGLVAEQIFALADLIVVPVVPASLSMRAYQQLAAMLGGRPDAPALLPVFSLADKRRAAHRHALENEPGWIAIPYAAAMERMTDTRQPVATAFPRSPAVPPLAALWKAIERRLRGIEKVTARAA